MTRLQLAVDVLCKWAKDWQLTISVSKCCMMHIGKQKRDTTVHMSGDIVPVVESVRDLGVLISNDLQPSVHVNDIVSRAHKRAAATCICDARFEFVDACFSYLRPTDLRI